MESTLENTQGKLITMAGTVPAAIACRGTKILLAAGRELSIMDINHPLAQRPATKLSSFTSQLHISPHNSNVIMVEVCISMCLIFLSCPTLQVQHREHQILVYDIRKSLDKAPDAFFGHRSYSEGPGTRYARGDTEHSLFVRGYPDGTICIWDFRNPKVCHSPNPSYPHGLTDGSLQRLQLAESMTARLYIQGL